MYLRKEIDMEKISKELKGLSLFIGVMGVLQVLDLLTYLDAVKDMDAAAISAMSSVDLSTVGVSLSTILPIVKGIGAVPFVLSILLHLILCIKGLKEAKDPSPAKFHIVLAIIGIIGYAFVTLTAIADLFSSEGDMVLKVLEVVVSAASAALMFYYSKYARQLRAKE